MLLYWWKDIPNFGDRLMAYLVQHFTGVAVEWADILAAEVIGAGSILEHVPMLYRGVIAGAGMLGDGRAIMNHSATWLGVRGPLSAQYAPRSDIAIGDPGLLANELVTVPTRDVELGIVPHWSDTHLAHDYKFQQWNPMIISPWQEPLEVVRQIGRCKKIISSSLHGLIVADSFGIPRRFEYTKRFDDEGGTFKFEDYNASIGLPFKVGLTQEADYNRVQDRQSEVYDMLRELPCYI